MKYLKTALLGLLVWVVPFLASFFVWDAKINAPSISAAWFYALMGVTGAIGFGFAAYYQFKDMKKDVLRNAWITGIIWYFECVLLDLVFLVGLFGMALTDYYHLLLTYMTPLILSITFGYVKR